MTSINKTMNPVVLVLVQTSVVLIFTALIVTTYVDNRIVKVKEYVDNQSINVQAASIGDIIKKAVSEEMSPEDIESYTDDLFGYYASQGIVVLEANNILAGPNSVFQKIPNREQLNLLIKANAVAK